MADMMRATVLHLNTPPCFEQCDAHIHVLQLERRNNDWNYSRWHWLPSHELTRCDELRYVHDLLEHVGTVDLKDIGWIDHWDWRVMSLHESQQYGVKLMAEISGTD